MRSTILLTIQVISATLLIQTCCAHEEGNDWNFLRKVFEERFVSDLKNDRIGNACYAIFHGDSIIFSGSFSGTEGLSPVPDLHSKYLIGSVSKLFTALAVMQLADENRIHLDSAISAYLPDFSINQRFESSGPITVRSVLTHHSGLPGDIYKGKFVAEASDFNEVLAYLMDSYTTAPVNTVKAYSNLGYALLGVLIERVSGLEYEEYLQKHFFRPLGMHSTGIYRKKGVPADLLPGYTKNERRVIENPIFDVPAGGIYSSVYDMVLFLQLLVKQDEMLLSKEFFETMFEMQNGNILLDLDDRSAICLTLRNKAFELGRTYEHGGSTLYHRAQIYLLPDCNMGAVMLSNTPGGTDHAWKLNEDLMPTFTSSAEIKTNGPDGFYKPVNFTALSEKDLKEYAGIYSMPGMISRFDWENDQLHCHIKKNSFYLLPEDEYSFRPAKRVLGIMAKSDKMMFFLEEIAEKKYFIQAMPWGDLVIIGTKMDPPGPIPEVWMDRTGSYSVINYDENEVELINSLKITEKYGYMILQYTFHEAFNADQHAHMSLDIVSDEQAFVLGTGRGAGESVRFIYNPETNRDVMHYMGLKAIKINKNE